MQKGPKTLQLDPSYDRVRTPSPLPATRHTPPFARNRPRIQFVRPIPANSDQIRVKNKNKLQTSIARYSAFRVLPRRPVRHSLGDDGSITKAVVPCRALSCGGGTHKKFASIRAIRVQVLSNPCSQASPKSYEGGSVVNLPTKHATPRATLDPLRLAATLQINQ